MDEKQKIEIKILSDLELSAIITKQDEFLSKLSHEDKREASRYILTSGGCLLQYFGAKHIFDPTHSQFNDLKVAFNTFVEGKSVGDIVVFVEGSIPAVTQDIFQDTHLAGERGFITHLAQDNKIEVRSIEPDRIVEMQYLLEKFSPDQIIYYYYLRAVRDYFRFGRIQDSTTFEEYSKQLLDRQQKLFGSLAEYSNYKFTLESIKSTHREITGADFDPNNRLDIDPRNNNTVINTISKKSSNFRDFYHIRQIEEVLLEGKSVFVVSGEEHAIVQKPAFEQMGLMDTKRLDRTDALT